MRLEPDGRTHLTYCTNIHPGERWEQVRENLERYLPEVKARVCPDAPFGIGLRLSNLAAEELSSGERLSRLRSWCDAHDLYVFTINGFPFGPFHGQSVKEQVYLPDWRDPRRLAYSDRLASLLVALLPDDVDGSVSTVPGAFAAEVTAEQDVARMADLMLQHAATLHRLRQDTGHCVALALEPEPCCYMETIEETVAFFSRYLLGESAVARISQLTGVPTSEADALLSRHLGVCFDTCHAAVEFENVAVAFDALADAGIGIKKIQLSAGLRIEGVNASMLRALTPFVDEVYLHQVVERRGDQLQRYLDLPQALAAAADQAQPADEWRVHFHVPIFLEHLEQFGSTQAFLGEVLERERSAPTTRHLEVETYTWDVLPRALRSVPVTDAIARELNWVLARLKP